MCECLIGIQCNLNIDLCLISGGSTDSVTYEGCVKAVDIMADYLDGKGAINRVI